MSATVIILNGVSSAGKTSVARAIQQEANTTYLHIEMDAFISFLPNGHEFRPEWFKLDMVDGLSGKLPRVSNGPRGKALLSVMRTFVIKAAEKGLDLIVDEVCHASEVAHYRSELQGCNAHIIKVLAPIDLIEARERARGDRLIGLAREQTSHLHEGIVYDGEIDTSKASPTELAAQLISSLSL